MKLEILGVPQAVCFGPHIQILGHWDNPVSWNQRPEKNQAAEFKCKLVNMKNAVSSCLQNYFC